MLVRQVYIMYDTVVMFTPLVIITCMILDANILMNLQVIVH